MQTRDWLIRDEQKRAERTRGGGVVRIRRGHALREVGIERHTGTIATEGGRRVLRVGVHHDCIRAHRQVAL